VYVEVIELRVQCPATNSASDEFPCGREVDDCNGVFFRVGVGLWNARPVPKQFTIPMPDARARPSLASAGDSSMVWDTRAMAVGSASFACEWRGLKLGNIAEQQ